ncbi:hypothetical protein NMG60_11003367 [Bertholletia excelsa]
MASGTSGANEPRETRRWGEGNNKVYTRRVQSKGLKNTTITVVAGVNTTNTAKNGQNAPVSTSALATSNKESNKGNDTVPRLSSQTLAAEGVNSSQPQQTLSREDAVSDDSSNHSRLRPPQVAGSNGCELPNRNGTDKPAITRFENRVKINLAAVRNRDEVRKLKRKLLNELYHVRNLLKQLDAKEVQLSAYSAGNENGGIAGYGHPQFSANGRRELGRVNSEVASVGHQRSVPFRQLSVPVQENNRAVGEPVEKEKRTPKANQYYKKSEFLLAEDRLPPADSNKKLKSKGRKKYGRDIGYGFCIEKYTSQALKNCNNLLTRLMKHKHAWVFNKPVDAKALGLHDYHDIIKHPMDLGTIKSRLSKNWYKSPKEFMEDVRLTFHNAMVYNPKGQDVYLMAEELLKMSEVKWSAIEAKYSLDWRYELVHDVGLPTPNSRKIHPPPPVHNVGLPSPNFRKIHPPPPPPVLPPPALETRTFERVESVRMHVGYKMKPNIPGCTPVPKKPKAKDPHKRDMTHEERQLLSTNLQKLPSEKLDSLVKIIKKKNSALSQHDDEIELDIDSVDVETLWELDRFVTNYKKSLSKNKRKAELALQAREEAIPTVLEGNSAPSSVEPQKDSKIDEANATNPSIAPGEKQQNSISGSSSSSSSSSDSGSSSSDSDSDSSSADGSDAGHSPVS